MARDISEQWERLSAVIEWSNMTTNSFAKHIGLTSGEVLYRIKRGCNGISYEVADRVVARFPEINRCWLLCGEGRMQKE